MGCHGSKAGGASGAHEDQQLPMRINVLPPTPRGDIIQPLQPAVEEKQQSPPPTTTAGRDAWSEPTVPDAAAPIPPPALDSPNSTQLRQQLNQLTQTNQQLLEQLHASEAREDGLKAFHAAIVTELTQAKKSAAAIGDRDSVGQERAAAQKEQEALRKEVDLLKSDLEAVRLERDQLKADVARLEVELAEERDPIAKSLREHRRDPSLRLVPEGPIGFKTLEKEVAMRNEVQSALNEHKAMLKEVRTRELALQKDHLDLTRRFGESQTQLFDQSNVLEECELKLAERERELTLCQDACRKIESDLAASETFVRELRSHLQSVEAKQATAALERKAAISTAQAAQFEAEQREQREKDQVEKVKKELKEKEAQVEELQRLLHSALHTPRQPPPKCEGMSTPIGRVSIPTTTEQPTSESNAWAVVLPSRSSLQKPLDSSIAVAAPTHPRHSSSLEGDAEFQRWLAEKKHREREAQATNGAAEEEAEQQATIDAPIERALFPFSPTKSQALFTPAAASLSSSAASAAPPSSSSASIIAPSDPLLHSQAFPTPESEAEFAAWLQAQRVQQALETAADELEKQNQMAHQRLQASSPSAAGSSLRGALLVPAEPHRPVTARTKEGEAEFDMWLKQQQQQQQPREEEASHPQPQQPTHQVRASWPHFQPNSPEAAAASQQQQQPLPQAYRKAWKDTTASNPAELREQIFAASTSGRFEQQGYPGGRKPQHAAAQSMASTLPSWAEGKAGSAIGPAPGAAAAAADSNFNRTTTSLLAPSVSAAVLSPMGSSSARSPTKLGYTAWQSRYVQSPVETLTSGLVAAATTSDPSIPNGVPLGRELDSLRLAAPPVLWLRGDTFCSASGQSLLTGAALDDPKSQRRVSGWLDSSPAGNHATVVSQTNRSVWHERHPGVHGASVVELAGGTALQLRHPIRLAKFTLFVVAKIVGQYGFYLLGGQQGVHLPCFTSGAPAKFATKKSSFTISDARSSGSSFARGVFVRARTIQAWLHGHEVTSGSTVDDTEVTIEFVGQMCDEGGAQASSPASIAEIILFDRALDDAERQAVDKYLAKKFFETSKP